MNTNTNIAVTANTRLKIYEYLSSLLHDMGIPASIRGYDYIIESVNLALDDCEILHSITKRLYPDVAKRRNTTPSRVERAMRHAIEIAWERGDIHLLNKVFGYTVKSSKGKPTNSEFISMLTERVRLSLNMM